MWLMMGGAAQGFGDAQRRWMAAEGANRGLSALV